MGPSFTICGGSPDLAGKLAAMGYEVAGQGGDAYVLDLRADAEDGLAALAGLAVAPDIILAIVGGSDEAAIGKAVSAGTTHILSAPFTDVMLAAQLRAIENSLKSEKTALETDSLTGLKTAAAARRTITEWLSADNGSATAMVCGLRHFENVNATFGAASGDAILENIAQQICDFAQHIIGEKVLVARFGGRDFMVATDEAIDRRKWQVIATELMEIVTQPLAMHGQVIRLTARAALAVSAADEDAQSYIGRLTHALADAHKQNAHRIKWADRASDAIPESGYQLEADLLRSIERDEIKISLQPQFSVETGALVGAEALARWEHGEFGEVGAATLFALAERTDFTEHLSAHIGILAMKHAARWSDALSYLRLSLNVTAQQLASPRFVESQKSALEQSGFDAEKLTLEITESALIGNLKNAAELLGQLREAGIRIAIDDFGTGYSNFLYLKSLPLDYIKMDHAMTRDIASGPRDRVIVRSIIALGQSLGLDVIAEGVESEEQLSVLKEEGCQYYQGFLRAKSMTPEAFEKFALCSN